MILPNSALPAQNGRVANEARPKITVKSMTMQNVLKWTTAQYNLYVKFPDGRFVIVLRKGHPVDLERLEKYSAKGVSVLFASETELPEGVTESDVATMSVVESAKFQALEKASEAVFNELRVMGITEAAFHHARTIGNAVRTMLYRNSVLGDAFDKFQDLGSEDVRHSLMVSAFSTVLVSSMEWVKPATHENVAMGALLHDFGLFMLPREIVEADPATLSGNDRKIFEGHAETGRALLSQIKTIPEDIQMIVAHHHERSDGSGYPSGLKDFYIHPLARVVGLANEIVEFYEKERDAGRPQTARFAIEFVLNAQSSKFNRDLVKSLRTLLQSQTPFL